MPFFKICASAVEFCKQEQIDAARVDTSCIEGCHHPSGDYEELDCKKCAENAVKIELLQVAHEQGPAAAFAPEPEEMSVHTTGVEHAQTEITQTQICSENCECTSCAFEDEAEINVHQETYIYDFLRDAEMAAVHTMEFEFKNALKPNIIAAQEEDEWCLNVRESLENKNHRNHFLNLPNFKLDTVDGKKVLCHLSATNDPATRAPWLQLCVPTEFEGKVMKQFHTSNTHAHRGANAMRHWIAKGFYFPNMGSKN